jgi:hypothetical protein
LFEDNLEIRDASIGSLELVGDIFMSIANKADFKLQILRFNNDDGLHDPSQNKAYLKMLLDFLFSVVELNDEEYIDYFFECIFTFKQLEPNFLISYLKEDEKPLSLMINKYINFVQNGYHKNKTIGKYYFIYRSNGYN